MEMHIMKEKKKIEKNNKTICLCAIVKNEGKILKRLIDSCRKIIDYWVIIDTGSTDDTLKVIFKELQDKIPGELHESKFVNFGHNRTELIKSLCRRVAGKKPLPIFCEEGPKRWIRADRSHLPRDSPE